ncbi:EAL domain-containing response regulator [Ancylobacter radicis]|uniref:EAL domain-containing response regulator n=1 Tax=Ancylobacter radicis TaxID=2836179 RepID=A0ABS5RCD9_9HYPH|nr:EAL domain-containing response regulator [Ancylobacter radicis]MBS9479334.1 EAL domain-containing response regulator [Ancylobacter radicis]
MRTSSSFFVLDDDADFREGLIEALTAAGCSVEGAGDPSAVPLASFANADILLLDLALPATDGFGMLAPLACLPNPPSVIFISGNGEELLRAAGDLGRLTGLAVLGTLEKPIEIGELLRLARQPPPVPAASPRQRAADRARIRTAVTGALAQRALPVMFQPLARAGDLSFVGAEALLGNQLDGFGPVSPLQIIAALEEVPQMIIELSYQVLDSAAALCARWCAAGWEGSVSVNMPLQVLVTTDAVSRISTIVAKYGVPPHMVVLELTEDAIYHNYASALTALARLRLAGFGLALDDVGQRQSGLMQLARLPVTAIKIDLELLRQARDWAKPRRIIASLSGLGHQLGLKVVAEGVETWEDLERVRKLGVDYVQGFLISHKEPASGIMEILAKSGDGRLPIKTGGMTAA